MTVRLFADATACAIFEEASGGGDPLDPNSAMNRPFKTPMSWLGNIYFHSDFNYYGVVAKDLNKVINHAAVAGGSQTIGGIILTGAQVMTDHVLITHNLGYVPLFFVAFDGMMFARGTPTQQENGGQRYVMAYATTTQIILRDAGFSTLLDLPAATRTYQVLVFRELAADPTLPLLDIAPGVATFGQGKFQIAQNHLRQVGAGASPFSIQQGASAAVSNGGMGVRLPDGTSVVIGGFNGTVPSPPVINVGI